MFVCKFENDLNMLSLFLSATIKVLNFVYDNLINQINKQSVNENNKILPDKYTFLHTNLDYRILGIIISFTSTGLYDSRSIEDSNSHPSLQSKKDRIWEHLIKTFDEQFTDNVKIKEQGVESLIDSLRGLNELIGAL